MSPHVAQRTTLSPDIPARLARMEARNGDCGGLHDYTVPSDAVTERAVLGCVMLQPNLFAILAGENAAHLFDDLRHQNIFEAMSGLFKKQKEITTLTIRSNVGDDDAVGGLAYLASLSHNVPSPYGFETYLDTLRQKAWLRQVQESTYNLQRLLSASATTDVTDEIEQSLAALLRHSSRLVEGGEIHIKDAIHQSIASMEAAMKNGGAVGVPTGFPALDRLTSGMKKGDYWIIAGRPSMGKTSLALNIAEHAAVEEGVPVGILSMEMTAESLATRLISGRSRVSASAIRDGKLTADNIKKITLAAAPVAKSPLLIDQTPSLSHLQIISRARRMKAQHNIGLLVVDYIQLANAGGGSRDQRWREVAEISASLKQAAKENDIAVLALSQLSRDVEQAGRAPRLSDLRESGSLEQDADVVGLLHRPSVLDDGGKDNESYTELIIAKQRNGGIGTVELDFIPHETRFTQHLPL